MVIEEPDTEFTTQTTPSIFTVVTPDRPEPEMVTFAPGAATVDEVISGPE
jgi:hypothetical protein